MRPRIGITTSFENGKQMLDQTYVLAIENAGGLPLIVPMLESDEAAQQFASMLDGLVMTGGPGITRGLVGDLPADLAPVEKARDHSDERIYKAFQARPLLGICYGMQFVNAMHGGTIYGDVSAQAGVENHSAGRGASTHAVQIVADSHLSQILQQESLTVNTYHIQALATVGEGLRVAATAPDGVIEAVESLDGRFIGLQFHPERMGDAMSALFVDFVKRCRR